LVAISDLLFEVVNTVKHHTIHRLMEGTQTHRSRKPIPTP